MAPLCQHKVEIVTDINGRNWRICEICGFHKMPENDKLTNNLANMKARNKKMMNTVWQPTIMADKLKKLGFTYKMNIWSKGTFTIQFYKYLWKCSVPGSIEFDVIYMKDLYAKYWELTGLVLPRIQGDED